MAACDTCPDGARSVVRPSDGRRPEANGFRRPVRPPPCGPGDGPAPASARGCAPRTFSLRQPSALRDGRVGDGSRCEMNGAAPGIGLKDRLVRIFGSSASLRDALVLLAVVVLAIVLGMFVDLLPALASFSREHPEWQVDKLFILHLVLTVGFFFFAICRMREIGAATVGRSDLEARFRDFVAMADEWFWEMDAQLRLTEVDEKAPAALVALARRRAAWQPRSVGDDAWARHRAQLAARKAFRGFRFHLSDDAGTV